MDEIFNHYLSRPNVQQPILTQYCDGKNVTCKWLDGHSGGSLLFWESRGTAPIEISASRYYGVAFTLILLEERLPEFHLPGRVQILRSSAQSSAADPVKELARISQAYPAIPTIAADGIFRNVPGKPEVF
ncbi:MAG: hypothetical protein ACLTDV_04435 [Eubacterium sp.]